MPEWDEKQEESTPEGPSFTPTASQPQLPQGAGKNKTKEFAKEQGKKLLLKAAKAILSVIISIISALISLIVALISFLGIFLVVIVVVVVILKNLNFGSSSSTLLDETRSFNEILSAVFYEKYSDESYYYQLSLPKEVEDDENYKEEYSEKTYSQLSGLEKITLAQADATYEDESVTEKLRDIDNYEENVKMNSLALAYLDKYLNNAGKEQSGVYYPEQFTKALYVGDSCDLNDEDLKIKNCKLGDLSEALSIAYEKDEETGLYKQIEQVEEEAKETENSENTEKKNNLKLELSDYTEEEQEELINGYTVNGKSLSVSDYGLASLVHYQAYFQPSRVTQYKIKTITVIDEDWIYGSSGSPTKTIAWNTLSEDEQNAIMEDYKTYKYNTTNKFSSNAKEGVLNTTQLGFYRVEDELKYVDWSDLYFDQFGQVRDYTNIDTYSKSEYENKLSKADPGVSTGLRDTEVVYAIDYAVTYFQDVNFTVSQKWTDMGDATNTQEITYFKEYTWDKATEYTEDLPKGQTNAETYLAWYVKGELVGYIAERPKWNSGTITFSTKNVTDDKLYEAAEQQVKEACENSKKTNPNVNVSYCEKTNAPLESNYQKTVYEAHYTPGYWTATIVYNTDGSKCENSCVYETEHKEEGGNDVSLDEYNKIKNYNKDKDKENSDLNSWTYQPAYLFNLTANVSGKFQVKLVSHSGTSISSKGDPLDYLSYYIYNYDAYVPAEDEMKYTCNGAEYKKDDLPDDCGDVWATDTSWTKATMNSFNLGYMSESQVKSLKDLLNIERTDGENENETAIYSADAIKYSDYLGDDLQNAMSDLNTKYGKTIEKYSTKYGVNKYLLLTMMYTAQKNGSSNIMGLSYDKGLDSLSEINKDAAENLEENFQTNGWSLKNVKVFDKGAKQDEESLIIYRTVGTDDQIINWAAAKMQKLLEYYNGNILLALHSYNAGIYATTKLYTYYNSQTNYSYNDFVKNKYETGWYHFKDNLEGEANLNSNYSATYVADMVYNLPTSSITWITKDYNWHINGSRWDTHTEIWNKYSITDVFKSIRISNVYSNEIISALYSYDTSTNTNKWKMVSMGQKNDSSGIYHQKNTGYNLENTRLTEKVSHHLNDAGSGFVLSTIISAQTGVDDGNFSNMSKKQWISTMGFAKVYYSYKKVLGSKVYLPAESFETVKSPGLNEDEETGEEHYSGSWVISTDEDAEITSITQGVVKSVGEHYVDIYYEEKDTTVSYQGLSEVLCETGDEAKKLVIGKSSGEISIQTYHNGEYYNTKELMDEWMEKTGIRGTLSFMGLFTGSFGSYSGKLVRNPDDMWAYINATTVEGAAPNNCTTFVNFMMEQYWGIHNIGINGNGNVKVERAIEVLSAAGYDLTPATNDLADFGDVAYNILWSWDDGGQYGHTGWINEYNRDEGYVIVSQGNLCNEGIQWKYKYSLEEWESTIAGNIAYVTLADENYNKVSDEEMFPGVVIDNESETAETEY